MRSSAFETLLTAASQPAYTSPPSLAEIYNVDTAERAEEAYRKHPYWAGRPIPLKVQQAFTAEECSPCRRQAKEAVTAIALAGLVAYPLGNLFSSLPTWQRTYTCDNIYRCSWTIPDSWGSFMQLVAYIGLPLATALKQLSRWENAPLARARQIHHDHVCCLRKLEILAAVAPERERELTQLFKSAQTGIRRTYSQDLTLIQRTKVLNALFLAYFLQSEEQLLPPEPINQ